MTDTASPFLSVLIPVRNGMPYLRTTIESLVPQLTDEVEVIVRNNFSTDGTRDYLDTIDDPRITVVEADEPATAGGNWSALAALARGTYTKILCADDTLLPGGLARQLEAVRAHPDATLVASRRTVIDENGTVIIARHGLGGLIGERAGADAVRRAVVTGSNPFGEPSSTIFRTDALQRSLPFTEEFPYLTDLDMYAKALQHGTFVGLPTLDATFRVSSTSWSASVGDSQLTEFRQWVADLERRGSIALSSGQRARMTFTSRGRFLARRAITTVTPVITRLRRR